MPVPPRERGIAGIRQPTTLFPHLTVFDNVTDGSGAAGGAACRRGAAGAACGRSGGGADDSGPAGRRNWQTSCSIVWVSGVSLEPGLNSYPAGSASGSPSPGHWRGRSGRFSSTSPSPLVDVPSWAVLRQATIDTSAAQGAVAMLVTHDLAEAQAFGHTIAVVDTGRILQTGKAAVIARRPESRRGAELLGYTTFVPTPNGGSWALHPDRFLVGRHEGAGPVFTGVVRACRPAGARFACELECAGAKESPRREGCESVGTLRIEVRVDVAPTLGTDLVVTADAPPHVTSFPGGGQEGGRSSARYSAAVR